MEEYEAKKRLIWLDCLKAILIIAVIVGHSCDRTLVTYPDSYAVRYLDYFIYGFHMAAFFAVSGYTYHIGNNSEINKRKADYKSYLKKTLISLGIPYAIFAILIWIGKMVFSNYVVVKTNISDLLLFMVVPVAFLWFIYVLMEIRVFTATVDIMTDSNLNKLILLSVMMQIVSLFLNTGIRSIDKFLYFQAFFVYGIFISKHKEILNNRRIAVISTIVFVIGTASRFYCDGHFDNITKLFTSYSGIYLLIYVFMRLDYSDNRSRGGRQYWRKSENQRCITI